MTRTILCFGDSNTYGYDPRSPLGDRYPRTVRWTGILAQRPAWSILNWGQNGREIPRRPVETAFLREQLERAGAPDVFLVMLGSNDLLQSPGYTAGDVTARMAAFLRRLAALPTLADTQLLLVPPPAMHPGAWVLEERLLRESAALAPAYKVLARELGIAFADCGDWDIPTVFDGVHFSEAGHRIFAREMCRVLEELLGG